MMTIESGYVLQMLRRNENDTTGPNIRCGQSC